ncbi:MAG: hypothetical protein ACJAUF_000447 [Bacteroidia bacterium]|jgi:hypothetical protein
MRNKIFLTLLCAAFFMGCAQRDKFSKKQQKAFYISIEKTACFGSCPIYILEVSKQEAKLQAKRFTEHEGVSNQEMSDLEYKAIQDSCAQADWGNYATEYLTGYSDLPSTIIRFSIHATDTIDIRYEGSEAPVELRRIGDMLQVYQKKMQAEWPASLD